MTKRNWRPHYNCSWRVTFVCTNCMVMLHGVHINEQQLALLFTVIAVQVQQIWTIPTWFLFFGCGNNGKICGHFQGSVISVLWCGHKSTYFSLLYGISEVWIFPWEMFFFFLSRGAASHSDIEKLLLGTEMCCVWLPFQATMHQVAQHTFCFY